MEFLYEPERIYATDPQGKLIAEITFPSHNGVAVIEHTFVDSSLRGQGVADQLVRAAVAQLKAQGSAAQATCSYASKWFAAHPEEQAALSVKPVR